MLMVKARSLSSTVEDYAKAIYHLQAQTRGRVRTNGLAEFLGVSPASASGMLKKLDDLGLVEYVPYRGTLLSQAGRQLAVAVVRRHRLIELYLVEALGLPWDRVHDEAEVLEHAVSPELSEVIATVLGDPTLDPHGDPIPTRDGRLLEAPSQRLDSVGPGQHGRLVRVSDRNPGVLRHLSACGIALGSVLQVLQRSPSGVTDVRIGHSVHSLDAPTTAAMSVDVTEPHRPGEQRKASVSGR